MKKINAIILIGVIFVTIVSLISALSIDVLEEDNLIAYSVSNGGSLGGTSGQWYLFPRSAETELLLDKSVVKNSIYFEKDTYSLDESTIYEIEDIAYAFLYDSVNQKYVQVIGSGTPQEGIDAAGVKDVSRYPVIWILPKENTYGKVFLRIDKEIMPSANEFTIKKGWNYFFTVPSIVGRDVSEWKGSCDIIKFASWDDEKAEWVSYSVSEINNIFSKGNPNYVGILAQVLAVKVSADCSFSVNNNPSVPPFPD
jgi:hypothetical protein